MVLTSAVRLGSIVVITAISFFITIILAVGRNHQVFLMIVVMVAVMFRDNSKLCSCGGDRQVFYWDVATGRVIRKFRGHDSDVFSFFLFL